jgi:hypothetical protein
MKKGSVENVVTTVGDMSNGQPDGTTAVRSELGISLERLRLYKHTRGLAIDTVLFSDFTQRGSCQGTVVGTVDSTVVLYVRRTRVLRIDLTAWGPADGSLVSAGAQVQVVSRADGAVLVAGSIRDARGDVDQVVLPAGTYEFQYHATHEVDTHTEDDTGATTDLFAYLWGPGQGLSARPYGHSAGYLRLPRFRTCSDRSLVARWLVPPDRGSDKTVRVAKVRVNGDLVARVRLPAANDALRLTHLPSGQSLKVNVWMILVNGDTLRASVEYVICA